MSKYRLQIKNTGHFAVILNEPIDATKQSFLYNVKFFIPCCEKLCPKFKFYFTKNIKIAHR